MRMKRGYWVWIIAIVLVVAGLVVFSYNSRNVSKEISLSPPMPTNCSDSSVSATWDSIFKESSSGITIITNSSYQGTCPGFIAYKIQGQKAHVLFGININLFGVNTTVVTAEEGNFTDEYLSIVRSLNVSSSYSMDDLNLSQYVLPRMLNSTDNADTEFKTYFRQAPGTWTINQQPGLSTNQQDIYSFLINESTGNNQKVTMGVAFINYSMNVLFYTSMIPPEQSCSPNWTAVNTTCRGDDTYTIWYNDTRACHNETGRPANITIDCDYNRNGIIGNSSSVDRVNVDLGVYLNSNLLNDTQVYNTTQQVEIRDGSTVRVSFRYPFSTPLNLKEVTIKKQPSSSTFGYLIVNGLEVSKNLTIDSKNHSNKVCVKNAEISLITEMSTDCDSGGEYLIDCPGSNNLYKCYLQNGTYLVTGLTSSAVKEILISNLVSCRENWSCSDWAACVGNSQNKTCNDLNHCNTTANRPALTQTCVLSCIPSWACGNWTPSSCPKRGNQTRICNDSNSCNVQDGKPVQTQTCEYKAKDYTMLLIIFVVIVIMVVVSYLILHFAKTDRHEEIKIGDDPYFSPAPTYSQR